MTMKRIIIALLILPFFIACNQKELEQLKADKVQLTETLKQKEVSINDFVSTLNSIEENLEIIKEKEKILQSVYNHLNNGGLFVLTIYATSFKNVALSLLARFIYLAYLDNVIVELT